MTRRGSRAAERALGVDLSEVQFQIVRAAHAVVVGTPIATMEAAKAATSAATLGHCLLISYCS